MKKIPVCCLRVCGILLWLTEQTNTLKDSLNTLDKMSSLF